jgi:hypothetical protein
MNPILPGSYSSHLCSLPLADIQPHSAYLAKECLETLAYDPERRLFLRRQRSAEASWETVSVPIIGLLDGQPMSIDGDHRLRQALLAGVESVPAATYDLMDTEKLKLINLGDDRDLELIVAWDHERKLREVAAQAGMGYEQAKAMRIPLMPSHRFVEYLREERAFLRSLGIRTYANLDGRLEATRLEADMRHLREFGGWKRSAKE